MGGDIKKPSGSKKVGYWHMVMDQPHDLGLGNAYFSDTDIWTTLFGKPVVKSRLDPPPFYRAVGVDENFQVAASINFWVDKNGVIDSAASVEQKESNDPLFKIDFDKTSLKGDFFMEDAYYPKTKIGNF